VQFRKCKQLKPMGESYRRRCKYCGEWIQLRQMPHGQWVPFDDYDTVHKCSREFSDYTSSNKSRGYSSARRSGSNSKGWQKEESVGCLTILLLIITVLLFSFL
jgi:hypothetical protein